MKITNSILIVLFSTILLISCSSEQSKEIENPPVLRHLVFFKFKFRVVFVVIPIYIFVSFLYMDNNNFIFQV